jgi:predicted Fe-S protein YdhL (DUF1289 family)
MIDTHYTSKTPCVGLCSTVYGDLVCRGCKRFSHEIIDWNRYQPVEKTAVWSRLEHLLTQLTSARVEVVSAVQLRGAMADRQMASVEGLPLPFQIVRLLSRADAPTLPECGLRPRAEYAHMSTKQLREDIDQTFFALSEAYYQRHAVGKKLK